MKRNIVEPPKPQKFRPCGANTKFRPAPSLEVTKCVVGNINRKVIFFCSVKSEGLVAEPQQASNASTRDGGGG